MKKKLMVLATIIVTMTTTGCSAVKGVKESISDGVATTTEGDKYNAYVELLNMVMGNLTESEQLYAENRMDESGNYVPADDQNSRSINTIVVTKNSVEKVEKVEKVVSSKPKMDIDEDAKEYVDVLKKEISIFEEINSYYSENDYLNDNSEKGKKLHEDLMAVYKELEAPEKKFFDGMQKLMDTQNKKEREKNEKDGNTVTIAMNDFIDAAEEATNVLYEGMNEEGVLTLSEEEYSEINTKVSKTLDALKTVSEDKEALKKEGYDGIGINSFVTEASTFKSYSNTVNGSFGTEELTMSVETLIDEYSKVITEYNRILEFN